MAVPKKPAVTAATKLTMASPILALADRRRRSNLESADVMKTAHAVPDAGEQTRTDTVDGRDSFAVTAFADIVDRSLHAAAARFTMGMSPAALAAAYLDWATHLAFSPGKRLQLINLTASRTCLRQES